MLLPSTMQSRLSVILVALLGVTACAEEPGALGQGQEVTIYRDAYGVPHVMGDTPEALFFGGGYAHAQDRLAEFERSRRSALGRMAELDPDWRDADEWARKVGYSEAETREMFDALDPEHQRMLEAQVAGINLAIEEALADPESRMPYEFGVLWEVDPEPWTVHDYISTYAAHRQSLSSGGGRELQNLEFYRNLVSRHGEERARVIFDDVLPLQDPDAIATNPTKGPFPESLAGTSVEPAASLPPEVPPVPFGQLEFFGAAGDFALPSGFPTERVGESRSLVVHPDRSASGNVIMVHATSDGPQIRYLGAGFDAYGYTRQGGGPLVMGRGPAVGWFQAVGWDDMVDIFAERLNPGDPYQYWFDGEWRDMERRIETIHVRGGDAETIEIFETVHGPVIAWDRDNDMAYSRQHALRGAEMQDWACNLEWMRAHSMAEFESSIPLCASSTKIQYGDEEGNIAHWHAVRRPIRPGGIDPRFPTPGTGEHEWQGWQPFNELSKLLNPSEGYIHVWNNKAYEDMAYRDDARWGATFRNYLAHDLMEGMEEVTLDDLKEINRKLGSSWYGTDITLTGPKFFAPYLEPAVQGDSRLEEAVEWMGDWNALFEDLEGDGYYDHVGLTIMLRWLDIARERILGEHLGEWEAELPGTYRTSVLHRAVQGADAGAPMAFDWYGGQDRLDVLRETVAQAVDELTEAFGTTDMTAWKTPIFWKYFDGDAMENHPDMPAYRDNTVHRDEFSGWEGTTAGRLGLIPPAVPANGSERWTGLMELTADEAIMYDVSPIGGQNQFINLAGEGTPNLDDQLMLHVNYEFKRVPMTQAEVREEAVSTVTLDVPGGM